MESDGEKTTDRRQDRGRNETEKSARQQHKKRERQRDIGSEREREKGNEKEGERVCLRTERPALACLAKAGAAG